MSKNNKECPNCGAENDLLFTNCQFCKTPLPSVDLNSISDEALIMNAAEWIGKISMQGFVVHGPNANQWTGKDIRQYMPSEINGYAQKYISLLEVRSRNNINLVPSYNELKEEFQSKTKSRSLSKKILIGSLIAVPIFLVTWCSYTVSRPSIYDIEMERLNQVEQQVIENIKSGDLNSARLLLNSMEYSISWSGRGDSIQINAWRAKKEGYRTTISEIESKGK